MSDPYDPEGNAGMDGVQERFRTADGPEPVAWRVKGSQGGYLLFGRTKNSAANATAKAMGSTAEPLYTRPVPDGPAPAVSEEEVEAAIAVFAEHGIDFRAPWQCDLDDEERERFDALRQALEAAQRARK